jgi:iron complex transport system substrate-binding protein
MRCEAISYKDDLGRKVVLNASPVRIISLAPSITEVLYYLGLEDRVVGVTKFSYYPPEAAKKPSVGSYVNLNVEKILSLTPDLVIGTMDGNNPGIVDLLEQANIPVYIVNPRRVREAISTVSVIGEICGVRKRANQLFSELKRRIEYVAEKTLSLKKPLVFMQINVKPIMSVNKNTIHHDVIGLAGGINMTQNEPITYPRISIEEVITRKPAVIIISSMERGGKFEGSRKSWLKWPGIPAVKMGRVHLIESDLVDRASPRIVKGLEIMARMIHPEIEWKGLN